MHDVWYVPSLKKNLLLLGQSSEKNIRVIFEEGGKRVLFYKKDKLLAEGYRENGRLYKLNFLPICKNAEANVSTCNSLMDWHEKLGHVNFQILRQMFKNSAVNDLKIENVASQDPFCEGCILAKQHGNSFPKNVRARHRGEIFHADLCGKMSRSSIGGSNYFLLLKDDFSRYCFVYFLKEKSDVLKSLQQFFADVQADGYKVKKLRTDCGKEFCNGDVNKFLLEKGVKHYQHLEHRSRIDI